MSTVWLMEDRLDESGCFQNGLSGLPASREAYLTVIDRPMLIQAIQDMKDNFSLQEWQALVEDLEAHAYLSPINVLTAKEIRRQIFKE